MQKINRHDITAGILCLLLLLVAFTGIAQAQTRRVPTVAILEFRVAPLSSSPAILGRAATDAVALEMMRTGRFDSVPRAQQEKQIKDSDFALPFSRNDLQRLGQALGADYVASGEVTEVSFTESPRRAHVTLSVQLTDPLTGEPANGAIQTGTSSAKTTSVDDDALIQEAISDAAFSIVRTINNYKPAEATILLVRGGTEVSLNQGSRDGIRRGQEMIVLRGSRFVGRIRVSSVGDTDSRADVIDGGNGIRPEDRARAVFQMPRASRHR